APNAVSQGIRGLPFLAEQILLGKLSATSDQRSATSDKCPATSDQGAGTKQKVESRKQKAESRSLDFATRRAGIQRERENRVAPLPSTPFRAGGMTIREGARAARTPRIGGRKRRAGIPERGKKVPHLRRSTRICAMYPALSLRLRSGQARWASFWRAYGASEGRQARGIVPLREKKR